MTPPRDDTSIPVEEADVSPCNGFPAASPSKKLAPTLPHRLLNDHSVLELELMHRWTMTTSRSVSCGPAEHLWMQHFLPQQAFRHRFILCNMLSTAALDIIASSQDDVDLAPYRRAALEYFNQSSALMRCELSKEKYEDDITHLLFLSSTFAVYNHLAIAQLIKTDGAVNRRTPTVLQRTCLLFDMCLGSAYILQSNPAALERNMSYVPVLRLQWSGLPLEALRRDDMYGLGLIQKVKGAVFIKDGGRNEHTIVDRTMYSLALDRLRLCYSHDLHRVAQGFCMSFPKYGGPGLGSAAKLNDPLAHLLFMYWGVLLHRLSADAWWIGTLGREMVHELSKTVLNSKLAKVHHIVDAVAWTLSQVEVDRPFE